MPEPTRSSQLTVTELDGLPPPRQNLYTDQGRDRRPSRASPSWSSESIEDRPAPRPVTPAYQDVSLAIQRALHPPDKIDPEDPKPSYDELLDDVEEARQAGRAALGRMTRPRPDPNAASAGCSARRP